eukprot:NODE_42_length_34079_cov_0.552619.p6 type:complete len:238 gc:universal NODE_42_length_34079_cov_0.552619:8146-8859(+)
MSMNLHVPGHLSNSNDTIFQLIDRLVDLLFSLLILFATPTQYELGSQSSIYDLEFSDPLDKNNNISSGVNFSTIQDLSKETLLRNSRISIPKCLPIENIGMISNDQLKTTLSDFRDLSKQPSTPNKSRPNGNFNPAKSEKGLLGAENSIAAMVDLRKRRSRPVAFQPLTNSKASLIPLYDDPEIDKVISIDTFNQTINNEDDIEISTICKIDSEFQSNDEKNDLKSKIASLRYFFMI